MHRTGRFKIYQLVIILILSLVFFIGALFIYGRFDPQTTPFPKCLFKSITGLSCPGCGSQRAIHQLLHLNVIEAFKFNPLFIIAIPYLLLVIPLELFKNSGHDNIRKWHNIFCGYYATIIVLVIVVLHFIARNIWRY